MANYAYLEDLKSIFESFSSGIIVVNCSGIDVMHNAVACRLLNLEVDGDQGKISVADLPGDWNDIAQILKNRIPQTGKEAIISDAKMMVDSRPVIIDNKIAFIINVFHEATKYRQVQKDSESINRLIEIIVDKKTDLVDGFWVNDRYGKVVAVNHVSAKRINSSPKDVVGMNVEDFVHTGVVDKLVTHEVINTKAAVTCLQRLSDGKRLLATGTPLFDHHGEIDLVIVNESEISDASVLPENFKEDRILLHHPREKVSNVLDGSNAYSDLILQSRKIQDVFSRAMRVAAVDSSVLIQGESGIGKTLFAQIIHRGSGRSKSIFNRVDCGAIPESLIESELFGYDKGAFTGAKTEGKPGQFEMTEGGTLFLDEVAELSLMVQVKILRFLDDKEVIRVGGTRSKKIDLRILAATNKNLEKMVEQGTFRSDLFFRLNVVPLYIPPLRERVEDIPPLIDFYLSRVNQKYSMQRIILPRVYDYLKRYSFPGNVRELENLVERLVVLSPKKVIGLDDLPSRLLSHDADIKSSYPEDNWNLPQRVADFEREFIIRALTVFGSQRKAAIKIGIEQSTLSRKIKRYKITVDEKNHHDE
jgi:transcriptional regulator with PAS, ATPase and Fis domain